jgi:hypothetical protein
MQQTHCYATGTVALLRKRNKPIVTQQGVIEPREPPVGESIKKGTLCILGLLSHCILILRLTHD